MELLAVQKSIWKKYIDKYCFVVAFRYDIHVPHKNFLHQTTVNGILVFPICFFKTSTFMKNATTKAAEQAILGREPVNFWFAIWIHWPTHRQNKRSSGLMCFPTVGNPVLSQRQRRTNLNLAASIILTKCVKALSFSLSDGLSWFGLENGGIRFTVRKIKRV